MPADPGVRLPMAPATGLAHLRLGLAAVRGVLVSADLDAPVPGCPGWDLRSLAWHLGDIHRWVVGAIVEGHPDTTTPDGPTGRTDLLAWFDEGAGPLVTLLEATDPDAPAWGFGPKPRTARFWFRRQAHEHAVHAFDAVGAAGVSRAVVGAELALDGVDEIATVFFPRQVRLDRIPPLTRVLAVRADDAPDLTWVFAGDGSAPAPSGPPDALVEGPAWAIYLLVWGRLPLTDVHLRVTGDASAAAAVLGAGIVP